MRLLGILLGLALLLAAGARTVRCDPPAPPAAPTGEIALVEGVSVDPVGAGARSIVHTDAIEARIVAGTWTAPKAGDKVALPDGTAKTWAPSKADAKGVFEGKAFAGGAYLSIRVASEREEVRLLHAVGDDFVYVNGELRPGDVYGYGWLKLPVLLRKGENEFLFRVSRGRLSARLLVPPAPFFVSTDDRTVGDLDRSDRRTSHGWAVDSGIVMVNASKAALGPIDVVRDGLVGLDVRGEVSDRWPHRILPLSLAKLPVTVTFPDDAQPLDSPQPFRAVAPGAEARGEIAIAQAKPPAPRRLTYRSAVDGSVQYVAIVPRIPGGKDDTNAVILTLHGASVEATGQAAAYAPKTWATLVAPTNRRPYGFDWEDWGRIDVFEAFHAANFASKDPPWSSRYLTGHSMGGHGTWQLGVTFPGLWDAIGPSAGWISFRSYGGVPAASDDPVIALLDRATSPSDTLALVENLRSVPIYALHGDADDNVPVTEMRTMVERLKPFHHDFVAFEQKGAGHWWDLPGTPGADCVDWAPMMEFFRAHPGGQGSRYRRDEVDFSTMHPGVSHECGWVSIELAQRAMSRSRVHLVRDRPAKTITGTTENVEILQVSLGAFGDETAITVELDGDRIEGVSGKAVGSGFAYFERSVHGWRLVTKRNYIHKNWARCGPFKAALAQRFWLVYGTAGTPEENAWALAKARYDAEVWYYRGNGLADAISDSEFLAWRPREAPEDLSLEVPPADRNVILYGHRSMNRAWASLLGDGPVQVDRDAIRIGDKKFAGPGLACLFALPQLRKWNMVGVIAGTGLPGLRLTDRLPYFSSGVGIPDLVVLSTDMLSKGAEGVKGAGFFGNDWSVEKGEFVWR